MVFTRGNGGEDDLTAAIEIADAPKPVVLGTVPKWW